MSPDDDGAGGLERLANANAFRAELERLAALAPEPWATKLRAILDEELVQ
jgi:hypothetical protein